ncbi:uncharacterized protein [Triticum aestivum]|uniref:uncharacterized protein n=1 Tax=Triticum aestivum TaxID=4565 RepID=UPI001D02CAA2|nr:uncharacterized protein LOC123064262 [Triticum aestivum]
MQCTEAPPPWSWPPALLPRRALPPLLCQGPPALRLSAAPCHHLRGLVDWSEFVGDAMPLNPILQLSGSVLDVVLLDAAVPDELSWSEEVEQQGLLSSSAWTDGCVLLLS